MKKPNSSKEKPRHEEIDFMDHMKLIYHGESASLTYDQAYWECQQGYGINNPEKVSGIVGFFCFIPDIYAYGRLGRNPDEKMLAELKTFVRRFIAEDYGFVTSAEYSNNLENRWLYGTACDSIARYSFEDKNLRISGGVVLEIFKDLGIMYYADEDMTDVYARHAGDREHENQLVYHSRDYLGKGKVCCRLPF